MAVGHSKSTAQLPSGVMTLAASNPTLTCFNRLIRQSPGTGPNRAKSTGPNLGAVLTLGKLRLGAAQAQIFNKLQNKKNACLPQPACHPLSGLRLGLHMVSCGSLNKSTPEQQSL